MDIYQLDYILHEPEESEGWMYLAEVPALQGCMAWGYPPKQTLDELRAVAKALIQSRQERGSAPATGGNATADRQGKLHGGPRDLPRTAQKAGTARAADLTGKPAGPTKCGSIQRTSGRPHPQARKPGSGHREVRRIPGTSELKELGRRHRPFHLLAAGPGAKIRSLGEVEASGPAAWRPMRGALRLSSGDVRRLGFRPATGIH